MSGLTGDKLVEACHELKPDLSSTEFSITCTGYSEVLAVVQKPIVKGDIARALREGLGRHNEIAPLSDYIKYYLFCLAFNAARVVRLKMLSELAPRSKMCADLSRPTRIGPMVSTSVNRIKSL